MSERSRIEHKNRRPFEEMYGDLPDWAIAEAIDRGIIKIDPLRDNWREALGSDSIDFRLGTKIQLLQPHKVTHFDVRQGIHEGDFALKELELGEPFTLCSGQFVIAQTLERLTLSEDMVGIMEGRSSLARLGIKVFVNAARFAPGWDNYPVLEMIGGAGVPVTLYCGEAICAFSFRRMMADVERPYGSRGRYTDPKVFHSLIAEDKERYHTP